MLFAELGRGEAPDLFVRLDYDGLIQTNGGDFARAAEPFGVIAGSHSATAAMESHLRGRAKPGWNLSEAARAALDAWLIGSMTEPGASNTTPPDAAALATRRPELLAGRSMEAAVLSRSVRTAITFRSLPLDEIERLTAP